jgi:hypothetical protein
VDGKKKRLVDGFKWTVRQRYRQIIHKQEKRWEWKQEAKKQ